MRNVSGAFKNALANDYREYIEYADFTLADNTTLNLSNEHFWQNGFSYEDSVSANDKFQVGSAVINKVNLTLNNIYGDFDEYDFFNAKAIIGVGLEINGAIERVNFGEFTVVDQPVYNGALISIELYDNMFKFDRPYSESNLVYPASLDTIVRDACTCCNVILGTTDFSNKNFVVQERPEDENLTFREVIAYAAQIAGCYARIEYSVEGHDGRLALRWFDALTPTPPFSIPKSLLYTTDGMTAVIKNIRQDDVTTTIDGVDWFEFDERVANPIYFNSNSWIVLGGEAPSSQSYSFNGDINIFKRDGQQLSLYRQEGVIGSINFLKLRFEGYTRYNTTYQTDEYRLIYELFLLSTGEMFLNIIQKPTASGYLGVSNIISDGLTTTLTLGEGVYRLYNNATGWHQEISNTNIIDSIYGNRVSTDNVVITGIKVSMDVEHERTVTESGTSHTETVYEKAEYLEGTDSYVLAIENNPLIAEEQIQDVAEYLGDKIIGFSFRTASVTHGSDPSLEAGDVAYLVNGKGQTYPIVISKTKFAVGSAQNTESVAEEPIRNTAARYSAETQNYVKARKRIAEEKTQRQLIEDELNERIDAAGGLYETTVQQQGGGVITYLHNLPVLAESDIQIMVSSVGVMVTPNGTAQEPTWYGLTVDGTLLANILSVSGIHADWINTGQLVITKDGNEVFLADVDTGTVRISGSSISISSGDPIDSAMGYTLETPFTYSNNGQTANFSAVLYHRNEDVTAQFPASWFTWTLRTENGETSLGEGKSKSVAKSACSYGATVTCKFTTYENESELTDVDNAGITDVDNTPISTFTHVEGSRNIVDTPVKLQSSILLTDYIVSVNATEIYRTTHNEYGQFIYDNFVANTMNGKVAKAGDTMTGSLKIKGTDRVGTRPSENYYSIAYNLIDADGVSLAYYNRVHYTDGTIGTQIGAQRNVNDSMKYNTLILKIDESGNATVGISGTGVAASWRSAIGAVNIDGDTMSGVLTVQKNFEPYVATKNTAVDAQIGETIPSETVQIGRHIILDSTGTSCGWITTYKTAADAVYTNLICRRKNASGTMINHSLDLGIRADGTRYVMVSDAAAWRSGIGAAPADTAAVTLSNYNSNIVSGTNYTYAIRRHGIVIVTICFQLAAGTYASTDVLFKVSPVTAQSTRAVCALGTAPTTIRMLNNGECMFNNNQTLSSAQYLLGQVVYAY